MRKILLLILLVGSSISVAEAQENTGPTAQSLKKEIGKLEDEKFEAFFSTVTDNNHIVAWLNRVPADGVVHTGPGGAVEDRTQWIARLSQMKIYPRKLHDYDVHIYGDGGDGTIAVVAVTMDAPEQNRATEGTPVEQPEQLTNVWLKHDGEWRLIVEDQVFIRKAPTQH